VQILPEWEKVRLAEATHADVVAWVAELQTEGYSAATIRQAHRVLSLMLALAVRDRRALTTFVGGEVHGVVGSYSPDGRWIVYREQHPDRAPLMIMRPDGRHARTIPNLPGVVTRFIDWGPPHRTANARDTH
jgi:hypothetical protein